MGIYTDKAIAKLDALQGDYDSAHQEADQILLSALRARNMDALANAYERARTRLKFWYSL